MAPPWTETKLSIPEGLPCSTASNWTDIELIISLIDYKFSAKHSFNYGWKISSNAVARTVLKAADEPRHFPMGMLEVIVRI
jgi:hypothetical protein